MLAAALCTALLAKAACRELRAHAYARKKKKISEANAKLMSRASFAASSEHKKKKQGEPTPQSLGDDPVSSFCFTTALLLLYYHYRSTSTSKRTNATPRKRLHIRTGRRQIRVAQGPMR